MLGNNHFHPFKTGSLDRVPGLNWINLHDLES